MSSYDILSTLLLPVLICSGLIFIADATETGYFGYTNDDGLISSGMIPYQDDGWSHGSLFSAPNWLLAQIDPDLMSTVLDYGVTPIPTEVPPSFDSFIAQGYAALDGGNYREAYTAFKNAIQMKPTSADAWYGEALALESQKRYLSALDAYTDAIAYANGAVSKWASYAGKGRVLYALNRFSEAQIALETALTQYNQAGASHPEELDEINRLLDEISGNSGSYGGTSSSAYIAPLVTES